MKKHILLVWMLNVAVLSIVYVGTAGSRHPELIGIVLITFFSFMGIMVGLNIIIKKLDDKESKE